MKTLPAFFLIFMAFVPLINAQDQIIPFHKIAPELRRDVEDVYYAPTIRFGPKPTRVRCRKSTLDFVLDRLPLAARLAKAMKIGNYGVSGDTTGAGILSIDDKEGALTELRTVYLRDDLRVYYSKGTIESAFLPKIAGRGVIVLLYDDALEGEGIEVELSVFFRLSNDFLHLLTRAFRDSLQDEIDRRISKLIDTAMKLGEKIDRNPEDVLQVIRGLDGIDRDVIPSYEKIILGR